tara:strand:- start:51512 stop:51676 length:165 start_codon:yes stop_codon:yes gene_type:complete
MGKFIPNVSLLDENTAIMEEVKGRNRILKGFKIFSLDKKNPDTQEENKIVVIYV